jgi:hypothetical protein
MRNYEGINGITRLPLYTHGEIEVQQDCYAVNREGLDHISGAQQE